MIMAFDRKKPTHSFQRLSQASHSITALIFCSYFMMLQTRPCWMSHNIYVWHSHQASYFITHNLNLPHCRSNTKFRCLLPCDTHHFRRMGPENAPCPSTHQWTVATNSPNFSQPGFVVSTSVGLVSSSFFIAFGYLYWAFRIFEIGYGFGSISVFKTVWMYISCKNLYT